VHRDAGKRGYSLLQKGVKGNLKRGKSGGGKARLGGGGRRWWRWRDAAGGFLRVQTEISENLRRRIVKSGKKKNAVTKITELGRVKVKDSN